MMDSTFDDVVKNLQLIIDEVKDGDGSEILKNEDAEFCLQSFWSSLNAGMQSMSSAATKLCFAFSPQLLSSAEEARPLLVDVERSALAIVSAYYTLPLSRGKTLHTAVTSSVVGIIIAAQSLVQSISSQLCDADKNSSATGKARQKKAKNKGKHLQMTGLTWDYADKFTNLPTDNGQAVSLKAKEYLGLISDALDEIEEALADGNGVNDDEDDEFEDDDDMMASHHWSDADREVAKACTQLIKAAKSCTKKILVLAPFVNSNPNIAAVVTSEAAGQEIAALDGVAQQLSAVSPAVDELIESLYPPLNLSTVRLHCERLCQSIQSCLTSVRSLLTTRSDEVGTQNEKWVSFIEKAVEHNKQKTCALIDSMHSPTCS